MQTDITHEKILMNYLVVNYVNIETVIIGGKEQIFNLCGIDLSKTIVDEYVIREKKLIELLSNDMLNEIRTKLTTLKIKNSQLHSLDSPAFVHIEDIQQTFYYIHGDLLEYNEWLKNPLVRLAKIKKIANA